MSLYKVELFNARSLKNKLGELHFHLNAYNPDIVCITETWLQTSTPDSVVISDTDYSIFRKDRCNNREGGGVCILVNNSTVKAVPIHIPAKFDSLELVAVDIVSTESSFRLFVVYRPPSTSDYDPLSSSYTSLLCECIESLLPLNSTFVLCGDFNFPKINWSNNYNVLTNANSCSGIFLNLYYKYVLSQFVTQSTRYATSTRNGSILDLVFCNDRNFVFNTTVDAPFCTSDHGIVSFNVIRHIQYTSKGAATFDFRNADWANLSVYLDSIDFFSLFENCADTETIFSSFYSVLYNGFKDFVPVRKSITLSRSSTFYPYKIRKLLNIKAHRWRIYKHLKTADSLQKFKLSASECRSAIYNLHVERENLIIDSENVGKFFNYANRKFSCKSSVGPLKTSDGSLTTDPVRKSELLQSVFSSAFTHDNRLLPPCSRSNTNNVNKLNTIIFTPTLIKRVIRRINGKAKGGPDDIPPLFFKQCCNQLASPLAFIFNQSMNHCYLPPVWLRAFITPIFKKGDNTEPSNYRPIALTCTMCKIMETVIKDQLLDFLVNKNLISKHQHGFMRNRSTTTNLLECTHDWIVGLANCSNIDVIYIDFSKAFDSIVFSKLLVKLEQCGLEGNLINWISAFLHGRTQRVVLENCFSSVADVISGVPQGSVLGPILFLVFINDVVSTCCSNTTVKMFADDLKLYSIYNSADGISNLQQSLDQLVTWSNMWQLKINISKCHVLSIRSKSKTNTSNQYLLDGVLLKNVSSATDLGVNIDTNLSFKLHISTLITKALQRVGIFFRGFSSRRLDIVRKTFTTYIRPLLEYNSIVWNPSHKYLIDKLENVQRQFTKRIASLSHLTYHERLSVLELEPLELRRLRFDLIQYYKIFNNLTCLNHTDFFRYYQPSSSSRKSSPSLIKPLNSPNYLLTSFFYRTIDCWNSLPSELRHMTSLNVFKRHLLKVDLSNFLIGSTFDS